MSATTIVLATAMIVLCLYLSAALAFVHSRDWHDMDFWDTARRLGPIPERLGIALSAFLLLIDVAPEWRLPPLVLALAMTSLGISRDVAREWKTRKGRR